jgi:hypothetical protein
MNIIGLGENNLRIFSKEEMLTKAKERLQDIKDKKVTARYYSEDWKWDIKHYEEIIQKMEKEPLPYAMYRYSEMFDYSEELDWIGCQVTEEQYMEQLEVLPPVPFKTDVIKGYIVPEAVTRDVYDHIFQFNGKYYTARMPCQNKRAMASWY